MRTTAKKVKLEPAYGNEVGDPEFDGAIDVKEDDQARQEVEDGCVGELADIGPR